jgi:hypothetical protein
MRYCTSLTTLRPRGQYGRHGHFRLNDSVDACNEPLKADDTLMPALLNMWSMMHA